MTNLKLNFVADDRNITWIAECIAMNQRDKISNYISVF